MRTGILLGWLLLSMAAQAAPLLTVTEDWPPYTTLHNPQQADGAYARVVRIALQRSGLPDSIEVYPWARSLAQARVRPDTLLFAVARTSQRETQYQWLARLDTVAVYLWHRPGMASQSLAQARDCCNICTVRQDANLEALRAAGFGAAHLLQANSHADCLRLLQHGSVHYLALPGPLVKMLQQQQGLPADSLQRGPLLQRFDVYLAASHGTSPTIIQPLQRTLQQMQRSGESRRIIASTLLQATLPP